MHDAESGEVPRCPSIRPQCSPASHRCQPRLGGSVHLTNIAVKSRGCEAVAIVRDK